MAHYIDKDAVVAEIKRYKHKADERLKIKGRTLAEDWKDSALQNLCGNLIHFLDTLEVKEVDFTKELQTFSMDLATKVNDGNWDKDIAVTAKHFFEFGMRASSPITAADRGIAEEIIISLKQVENDYYLDQTKEIEWVRNKVKEGEI